MTRSLGSFQAFRQQSCQGGRLVLETREPCYSFLLERWRELEGAQAACIALGFCRPGLGSSNWRAGCGPLPWQDRDKKRASNATAGRQTGLAFGVRLCCDPRTVTAGCFQRQTFQSNSVQPA